MEEEGSAEEAAEVKLRVLKKWSVSNAVDRVFSFVFFFFFFFINFRFLSRIQKQYIAKTHVEGEET